MNGSPVGNPLGNPSGNPSGKTIADPFDSPELASRSKEAMGSVVEIKLPCENSGLFQGCFSEIERIEKKFSRFLADSELSSLNSKIGVWQDASPEMMSLLEKARSLFQETKGSFDISIKAALDRLGYDSAYTFSPSGRDESPGEMFFRRGIRKLLAPVSIDKDRGKVLLREEIDFGGFGKGYALDKVSSFLDSNGAKRHYINAGGDIYCGSGGTGDPWTILLEHPDDLGKAIGKVGILDGAIACSSSNRRNWGGGLHHLLNSKTRKPEQSSKAAFVLAKKGIDADAYATALFTSGFESAVALSKRLPCSALLISSENKFFQGKGFSAEFF